jgi:NitT/TauT family transport system substrate-binding protein
MMSSAQRDLGPDTVITIAPNPPVFDLPVLVALEEGLFAASGLDVRYAARYAQHDLTEKDVLKRLKESLFEQGSADTFNVCEWGGIDRIERGAGRGRIAALRPAVTAQAIVTFDTSLQVPRDLAGVAIGVNEFTGSHYTTLQLLEGAVGRERIVIEHIGTPEARIEALRRRDVGAVTLMEPFISLALKEGAHIVALTFYRGAEIIAPRLSPERRSAYFAVIDAAVDRINADFARYAHYVVEPTGGRLAPHELGRQFLRYTHVEEYDPERFARAYAWMQSWGLSAGANEHGTLVLG